MNGSFSFHGTIPAAKAMLNRFLLMSSHARGNFQIEGDSRCDDVLRMREGLDALRAHQPINGGEAAAVFRFLALKAARLPGRHLLMGSSRLLNRPHAPLISILEQLGCTATITHGHQSVLMIESDGWRRPKGPLKIDASFSSQFASAVILNAWELSYPVELYLTPAPVSAGYLDLTIQLARTCGMRVSRLDDDRIWIHENNRVRSGTYRAEIDLSSAFAVAALAAIAGRADISDFPQESLQPDRIFPDLLTRLGAHVQIQEGTLRIQKGTYLTSIESSLGSTPDLFPVLAVLAALADGESLLHGAPQLVYKESNRIEKVSELIRLMGREVTLRDDGLVIHGCITNRKLLPIGFDPADDHRLAFAAAVARRAGCPITLTHPEVVNKSFPEFWDIANA
ncbi:MAG: 3-phosphoshikimate 1-carboxyvinyltransferase [Deltaproteobacteria bacterium]|nr:3-phosphoshikimate 1-carboxyvinyltransferase [Deltaproteobacteria bacterium]